MSMDEARNWCKDGVFSITKLADRLEELSGIRLSHGQVRRYARRWANSRKKSQPMHVNKASMNAVYSWRHRTLKKIKKYQKLRYPIVVMDEAHVKDAVRARHMWGSETYEDTSTLERGSPRVFVIL